MLLYEYGGLYLDTDVIVLRQIPTSWDNFVCVESEHLNHLAAGSIKLQQKHEVMRKVLENLAENFSGSVWNANGPLVLEKVMREVCEEEDGGWWAGGGDKEGWSCGDVKILRDEYFYPVHWRAWKSLFQRSEEKKVLQAHSGSYATHLWGHQSRGATVEQGSAVWQIARTHCPVAAGYAGIK